VQNSDPLVSVVLYYNWFRGLSKSFGFGLHFIAGCIKIKSAPRHEGVLGSGCIAPRILGLRTRCRWVVSFTSRPLYPQGKSSCYPLDRRLGGPRAILVMVVKRKIPSPHLELQLFSP